MRPSSENPSKICIAMLDGGPISIFVIISRNPTFLCTSTSKRLCIAHGAIDEQQTHKHTHSLTISCFYGIISVLVN